ncbi:MAG: SMP-30/gluconolactonase/LRE family protein [Gemmatimonadetes bacterium]|nr:SMP-30/gluconolactonase/LRE family protein [Gemmatimonadota bacterium]
MTGITRSGPRARVARAAFFVLAAAAGDGSWTATNGQTADATGYPRIVVHDARFTQLIPADARIETIASGFHWVEGPVWVPGRSGDAASTGALLFSDIPANAVIEWRERHGTRVFLQPAGYTGTAAFDGREPGSNGLVLDALGRLVLCEHGDRRITRLEPDGTRTVLADRYDGRRLNSPNDAAFAPDGTLWFTDPPFGLPRGFDDAGRELDFSGVYRIAPHGGVELMTNVLRAPNGLAFSPDGRTLYVSNADRSDARVVAFDVRANGSLSEPRTFVDATAWVAHWPGAPDGMKTDAHGNLFLAGPGGVHVIAPDGTLLGSILVGGATSNVGWGGRDGTELYITAGTKVYRVRTLTGLNGGRATS